jgi:hypothetical protein
MGWMEIKVISDVVLTVGGLAIAILFLRQVYKAVNYLGHMAGEFMVLTTHTQPSCLWKAVNSKHLPLPTDIPGHCGCSEGGCPKCLCEKCNALGTLEKNYGILEE